MNRRNFIVSAFALTYLSSLKQLKLFAAGEGSDSLNSSVLLRVAKGFENDIIERLTVGELTAEIGMGFLGTPYVGGTLDGQNREEVIVNLSEMDCVTFWENSLGIANMLKKGKNSIDDLKKEIRFTRYRNGVLTDYTSRLHYTSDWILDNIKKGIIQDISAKLDAKKSVPKPDFMSKNPKYYQQLQSNKEFIEVIKETEKNLASNELKYIEKSKIASIESKIQSGDFIAIVTNKDGLDYAHVGMAHVFNGETRFLHASSKKKKVVLDTSISKYVNSVESHLGITVCRPVHYLRAVIDFNE